MNKFALITIVLLQAAGFLWITYLLVKQQAPKNIYMATTVGGRLTRLDPPLHQATMSEEEVKYIIPMVLEEVFSFESSTYIEKLKILSQYFTPRGWETWTRIVQDFGIINSSDTEGFIVEARTLKIKDIKSSVKAGRHYWELIVPMNIQISGKNNKLLELMLKVVVVRNSHLGVFRKFEHGVGIENIEVLSNE